MCVFCVCVCVCVCVCLFVGANDDFDQEKCESCSRITLESVLVLFYLRPIRNVLDDSSMKIECHTCFTMPPNNL